MRQIFKDFKELLRDLRFYLMLFGIVLIILLAAPAWSSEICNGEGNCNEPVSVGGNDAYAFGGADMDIRDCLATESYVFGLWQRARPNRLCLADKAQQSGKFEEAAKLRCSYWSVSRVYGGRDACKTALTLKYVQMLPEPVQEVIETDDDDDYHEEIKADMGEFESRVAKLESAKQAPPKVIRKTIQKPFLSDEQKAKLQAVLDE